jgi:hypothetical protein
MSVTFLTWNLIVASYLKLVLTDSVIEGSRTAALADQGIQAGKQRVIELTSRASAGLVTPIVSGGWQTDDAGNRIASISAAVYTPFQIEVTSYALAETQR